MVATGHVAWFFRSETTRSYLRLGAGERDDDFCAGGQSREAWWGAASFDVGGGAA